MTLILRRRWGTSRRRRRARSCPSTKTRPLVGSSSRVSRRMNVLLPAPLGPTRKTKSRSGICKLMSVSACTPLGYCLQTACRTIMGPGPRSYQRTKGRLLFRADLAMQPSAHEIVERAVQHRLGIARFVAGAGVLDQVVGMQDVRTNGVAEAGANVLNLRPALLRFDLVKPALQQLGSQDAPSHLAVLRLGPLVLAGHDDAGGLVGEAHGGG